MIYKKVINIKKKGKVNTQERGKVSRLERGKVREGWYKQASKQALCSNFTRQC